MRHLTHAISAIVCCECVIVCIGPLGKTVLGKHASICVGGPATALTTFSSSDGLKGHGPMSRQMQRDGIQKRKAQQALEPFGINGASSGASGSLSFSPFQSVMQGQQQTDANEFARAMHESARKDRKDRIRELNMLLAIRPDHVAARAELLRVLETPLPDTITFVKSWLSSKSSNPPSQSESVDLVTPTRESRSVFSDESCERVSPTSEESTDMSAPICLTNQMSCEINI